MLEIVMLIIGFVTLVSGKLTLGIGRILLGWRARVCGAILCSHLAIVLCGRFIIGSMGRTESDLPTIWTLGSMIFTVSLALLVGNLLYKGQSDKTIAEQKFA